jgi:Mrp family chromosome partitioning ATPase
MDGVLNLLRRGTWFALLLAAVTSGTAYLITSTAPPRYTAAVTVLVSQTGPRGGDLSILTPARVDPSVYQTALDEGGVASSALASLLGKQPDKRELRSFQREIRMTTQQNDTSSLLTIGVTDRNPTFAAHAANALADALATWDRNRAQQSVTRSIAALRQSVQEIDARLSGQGTPLTAQQQAELTALRQQRQRQLDAGQAANASAVVVGLLTPHSRAARPDVPSGPKVAFLTLVAAILGLLVGYCIVAVARLFDTQVRHLEDLYLLSDLPVLAEFAGAREATPQKTSDAASFLLSGAIRGLGGPPVVVAVTSSQFVVEKARVTINLAESAARSGYRTLLVDADLRRPSTSYGLDVSQVTATPLEVYLENPAVSYQPASVPIGGNLAYDFVPSFTSATYPVELLSRNFGKLLAAWREAYDIIIVDCPPVLPFAETLAIAPLCDGLVLSARRGATSRRNLRESLERLRQFDVELVGTVFLADVPASFRRNGFRARGTAGGDRQAIDPYRTLTQGPNITNVRVKEHHNGGRRSS